MVFVPRQHPSPTLKARAPSQTAPFGPLFGPLLWLGQNPRRLAFALALLGLGLSPAFSRANPSTYEKKTIEYQARQTFRKLKTLWQEELYFELYSHGTAQTRKLIGKEDFARRMVELNWLPTEKINPLHFKPRFYFRTMIYIDVRLRYQDKFNPKESFYKNHTFLLLLENNAWRIDLLQVLRAPYI